MQYLNELQMIDDNDKVPGLIPKSIKVKHYVCFNMALKQFSVFKYIYVIIQSYSLHFASTSRLYKTTEMKSADMNSWKGEVTDIWGKWLPHLRDTTRDYEAEDIMIYGSKVEVQKKAKSEIDHQDVRNGKDLVIQPNEAKGMKSVVLILKDYSE